MGGFSEADLARARRDTPGCEEVLHFNNAGASLMPEPVLDATVSHLRLEAAIGGYEAAARSRDDIERVYDATAALIGCHPDEVAVIENATRAWDMAFYSIPLRPGDRILTAMAEYASNYIAFLQVARKTGAKVEPVPNDERGQLSVEALREMMDERVKLIAITHVPTNGGLVNPAAAVGEVAREAGILYLLDACQSIGQVPIDVERIGCDLLSATGRKYLRGPRGTGFLYVRRDILEDLEPPFLDLLGAERCGIVTFTVEGSSAEEVNLRLSREGINTSVSPASMTLLDMEHRSLDALVRASVHYYNTEGEVTRFCEALERGL